MAAKTAARSRKKRSPWVRGVKRVLAGLFLLVLIGVVVFGFMFMQAVREAHDEFPKLEAIREQLHVKPSVIVSSDGKTLYEVSAEYRRYVNYDEIPEIVRNAVVAAEDKRFFSHSGIDAQAIGRIILKNAKEQRMAQGGSTITMQVAKLLFTNSERSFKRKLHDAAMALELERQLTKQQILEIYLNKVFFGSHAYGIQAASEIYFGKDVSKLDLSEAALLARLIRRPGADAPFRDPKAALKNRDVVLGIMLEEKMITNDQYEKALAEKPKYNKRGVQVVTHTGGASFFVDHVLDVFHQDFPDARLDDGGYRIETTLNMPMQDLAESVVREMLARNARYNVTTAAFILMDENGKILVEVGGPNYAKNQYNNVTQGRRQPGSAFKAFVYSAALSTGAIGSGDMISNGPYVYKDPYGIKDWTCHNDNGYGGPVGLQTAFAMSLNVVAARIMEKVGPETVVQYAKNTFGFTSPLRPYMSLALGSCEVSPLEMAQAYSVFMLHGNRATPYPITRVIGPDGEVLKTYGPQIVRNVLEPEVCNVMDGLLRAVVTRGTATRAAIVPNARGKTGTTSDNKDAWFCGFTDGLVGVGWVASEHRNGKNVTYEEMNRHVFGGTITAPFWAAIMKRAREKFGHDLGFGDSHASFSAKKDDSIDIPSDADPSMVPDGAAAGAKGTDGKDDKIPDKVPPLDPPVVQPRSTPPRDTPPPRNDPPAEGDDTEQYVEVEVCADTGLRASIYCPETVTRRFKKGHEPKRRCTKHGGNR